MIALDLQEAKNQLYKFTVKIDRVYLCGNIPETFNIFLKTSTVGTLG